MAKKYGKWQVVDSLNEGGQAYLYRVTDSTTDDFLRKKDPSTDDVFVLKRLKNKSRIKLFEQEIRAILGLNHSNVLRLADYDTQGDKPYYVAEYCNLGSLEGMGGNYFKGNIGRAVDVILPIIDALTAAHTAGIVHRDIKPPNILFRKDDDSVDR